MPFLILHKTGPELGEAEMSAIIEGKKKTESDQAILEGAMQGPGSYIAIWFNRDSIITKDVRASVEVVDPELPPAEQSEPTEEPEPEPEPESEPAEEPGAES